MYAVMNDPIPRPSRDRPEIPPALDAIVARALARTPGERFATAEDMRVALDQIAATLPRCEGHTIGRMMEKVFGTTRAQAKRAITQSRSLAHNVSLVMKTTATLPVVAPPTASSSTSALPVVALPIIAIPNARRRRWLVIDSTIASLCGVAAIFAFGSWVGASSPSSALSPPRLEAPIERAVASGGAQALAAATPPTPPHAVRPPAPPRLRTVAGPPGQGTLTIETYPNALVYLDGKTIEHGSFVHRPTATGTHELVVKLPGRLAVKRSISIAADHETKLKIEIVQQTADAAASAISATTPPTPAYAVSSSSRPGAQPAGKAPRRTQTFGSSVKSASSSRNPPPPAAVEARPKDPSAESPVPPAVKQPGLDVKAIRAAVRSQIGPLQQCYERAKMDDANLHGKVTAHITVAANGTVANVQIAHSTLNAPQVEGCISREITRWQLPRPSGGGTVAFLYPFVFE